MLGVKRINKRYTSGKSMPNSRIAFSVFGAPIFKAFSDAVDSVEFGIAFISGLIMPCGPSAIVRGISFVVVNAVNRQSFCALSHVCVERLKRANPFTTNSYPSTSVVLVLLGCFGKASSLHSLPAFIFSCGRHVMLTMRLYTVAPARCCSPILKVLASNASDFAAFTEAAPKRPAFNVRRSTCYNESSKYLSSAINKIVIGHNLSCKVV